MNNTEPTDEEFEKLVKLADSAIGNHSHQVRYGVGGRYPKTRSTFLREPSKLNTLYERDGTFLYSAYMMELVMNDMYPNKTENLPMIKGLVDVYELMKDISRFNTEHVYVLSLAANARLIGVHECSSGAMTHCNVDSKMVFIPPLLAGAGNIIMAHNHPAGTAHISPDDEKICEYLKSAGETIGIRLIDFVVIGSGGDYCSILEVNPDVDLSYKDIWKDMVV